MSLPPHLRQYVDPSLVAGTDSVAMPAQKNFNAAVAGPKPQYDWRARNGQCAAINLTDAPPASLCGPAALAQGEYVDKPKPKLTRTLGRDGKNLGIVGNVVHHPTGKQYTPHPASGREADNYLRRMTGNDPNRPVREACLAPTLMPDNSLGPTGEWGSTRELPGFGVEQLGVTALNTDNIDRIADGMLPFIRPDLHQWREKPVSYAKPTPQVRDPLIPDTRAGVFYQPVDIGRDIHISEAMPVLPHTDGWKRRAESAEHFQLPLEQNRGSKVSRVISGTVPNIRAGPIARADETPFEDNAHNLNKSAVPLMIRAIKRIHKKLQQPHTHAYGAALAHNDDDALATAYDGVRVDVSVTADRAANRTHALAKEKPNDFVRAYSGADGNDNEFDANVSSVDLGTAMHRIDSGKQIMQDGRAMRNTNTVGEIGSDEGDYAGSVMARPGTVREPNNKRRILQEVTAHGDDYNDFADGRDLIGSTPITRRQDDRRAIQNDLINNTNVDEELSAIADNAHRFTNGVSVVDCDDPARKTRRDVTVREQSRAGAYMATLDGYVEDIDSSAARMPSSAETLASERRLRRDRGTIDWAPSGANLVDSNAEEIDAPFATSVSAAQNGDRVQRLSAVEQERMAKQSAAAQRRMADAVILDDQELSSANDKFHSTVHARPVNAQKAMRRERAVEITAADDVEWSSAALSNMAVADRQPRRRAAIEQTNEFVPTRFVDSDVDSAADHLGQGSNAHRREKRDVEVNQGTHRGTLEDGDFGHGGADSVSTASRVRIKATDAHVNGAYTNTADDIEDVVTLPSRDQRVGSEQYHETERGRLREANSMIQRRDNVDCEIATDLAWRAQVCDDERTDRPIVRQQARQQRLTNTDPQNDRGVYLDELELHVNNQMHIAPPSVHLSRKYEREDGREFRVEKQLQSRLRSETPPPATHTFRNARFGRMLNASPSQSPAGSRCTSPVRF